VSVCFEWCCFHCPKRNSLVSLLEAPFARCFVLLNWYWEATEVLGLPRGRANGHAPTIDVTCNHDFWKGKERKCLFSSFESRCILKIFKIWNQNLPRKSFLFVRVTRLICYPPTPLQITWQVRACQVNLSSDDISTSVGPCNFFVNLRVIHIYVCIFV